MGLDLFQSWYDSNYDRQLTGFEKVHYEEDNYAYSGSLVPHSSIDPLLRSDLGYKDESDVGVNRGLWSYHDDDYFGFDDGLDNDYGDDDYYEPKAYMLDKAWDFGPEERYWFKPSGSEDFFRAVDFPKNLGEVRLRAHRCYNCKHWAGEVPTENSRDSGCKIYYSAKIDRDLDNVEPDRDGLVCGRFKFRHGQHG